MHDFSAFLFFCLLSTVSAYYSIPFQSMEDAGGGAAIQLYASVNIGTPVQQAKLRFWLDFSNDKATPIFANGPGCPDGNFDPYSSTTFKLDYNDGAAVHGNDTLSFASGYTHKGVPVSVYYVEDCWQDLAILSFIRSGTDPSFIRDYLLAQRNSIAVFTFDQVGSINTELTSGTLILGDKPTDKCGNWQYSPAYTQTSEGYDWTVTVNQVSAGTYTKSSAWDLTFSLSNFDVELPDPVYDGVTKALNVNYDDIDCDVQTKITLQLNGIVLTIGPEIYMDPHKKQNGKCSHRFTKSSKMFLLPITMFRNQCFMLDYKKSQIGLAPALKKN